MFRPTFQQSLLESLDAKDALLESFGQNHFTKITPPKWFQSQWLASDALFRSSGPERSDSEIESSFKLVGVKERALQSNWLQLLPSLSRSLLPDFFDPLKRLARCWGDHYHNGSRLQTLKFRATSFVSWRIVCVNRSAFFECSPFSSRSGSTLLSVWVSQTHSNTINHLANSSFNSSRFWFIIANY